MVLLVRGACAGPQPIRPSRWLIGGGLVLPVTVLTVLLAQGLRIGKVLSHEQEVKGLEVEVIARRWWWEFRYRDPEGGRQRGTGQRTAPASGLRCRADIRQQRRHPQLLGARPGRQGGRDSRRACTA